MNARVQPGLARFSLTEPPCPTDRAVSAAVSLSLALVLAAGAILATVQLPVRPLLAAPAKQAVTVRLTEVSVPRPRQPEPVVVPRLEPETILAAPVDRPAPEVAPEPVAAAPQPAPEAAASTAEPVRRVYGVRKVYARGLGSGDEAAGLVTKQGNTLTGPPDTLTATAADLQGRVAPLSTVDRAPEPLLRVQPTYSAAMRKARSEGVVAAWLLIDADGVVRDITITEDIGADSRDVAAEALTRFRFRPAERGGQPVAVWILHRIRFEFQE